MQFSKYQELKTAPVSYQENLIEMTLVFYQSMATPMGGVSPGYDGSSTQSLYMIGIEAIQQG